MRVRAACCSRDSAALLAEFRGVAGPGAGPVAGVGALLFQAVEGVPGRDRRGGRGQRAGRGEGDRVHGGLDAGPQHVVGEGDGDVAAGVPAVRPRDRADGGPAGGGGSRGRVVAGVVAAPGPEGGGDRAAAGRLRPGDAGGPAGLRGPVAAGPARPAGCRGRRAAARRHRLAGRRDRGHRQGQQDRAAPAAGPGRGGPRRLAGARAAEVRVAVGVRDGPAALPAADAGVGPGRHGQGLRAGRAGAAGNAPVPARAGDRDAAGRGLAARGRAGAAAPQHAVDLDLCQGRPERAAPAGPPVARERGQ